MKSPTLTCGGQPVIDSRLHHLEIVVAVEAMAAVLRVGVSRREEHRLQVERLRFVHLKAAMGMRGEEGAQEFHSHLAARIDAVIHLLTGDLLSVVVHVCGRRWKGEFWLDQ